MNKDKEEVQNGAKGSDVIELDESLLDGESDLQKVADELAEEHEKSKKSRKFFGGRDHSHKKIEELEKKIKSFEDQLKQKDEKIAEQENTIRLMVAENRNQKNRLENEYSSKIKHAVGDFFKDFITVNDDFDKAMEYAKKEELREDDPFFQGILNIFEKFKTVCSRHGLNGFSSLGEKFDPALHQAMSMVDVDGKEQNEIIAEYVKGYKYHDRVLRPAMVIVASGKPAAKPVTEQEPEKESGNLNEEPAGEAQNEAAQVSEEDKEL